MDSPRPDESCKKKRQEEGKYEWRRKSKREREVLGHHHLSPTHSPSTFTSLHYLHVNDSSLCPTEGRKGLSTLEHRNPRHFSAHTEWSSFTLKLPHMHAQLAWGRKTEEDMGMQDGHRGKVDAEECLICSTKAKSKMKSITCSDCWWRGLLQ